MSKVELFIRDVENTIEEYELDLITLLGAFDYLKQSYTFNLLSQARIQHDVTSVAQSKSVTEPSLADLKQQEVKQ